MANHPYIILVEPQLCENVGMAARAMKNCGLENLRLVKPRENHLSDKALAASSNSPEILQNAQVFDSLSDALGDLHYVFATTARHRDQTKMVYDAPQAAAEIANHIAREEKCGLVFGPERTGLRNEDVSLCDAIINIPLNPQHCSLNLSQAVLLAGYEYYKTTIGQTKPYFETNHTRLADKEKVLLFCRNLEGRLSNFANFTDEAKKDKLVLNLRNIFTRAQLTEQELNTLYGIVNYLAEGDFSSDGW
ncbi:MAG: RNA methyltransferase [Alphaproteobacteria bacterium]|nr:RNA methyltransferase [Alphaproteobacteria bacterium]